MATRYGTTDVAGRGPDRSKMALGGVMVAAAAALAIALGLEHLGGYAPCSLCILERWPWLATLAIGTMGLALRRPRPALAIAAVLLAGNAALSIYHVGVEAGWFELPGTCAAGGTAASIEELRAQLEAARPTCDRVALAWMGLSLAAWNGMAAAATGILAAFVAKQPRGRLSS